MACFQTARCPNFRKTYRCGLSHVRCESANKKIENAVHVNGINARRLDTQIESLPPRYGHSPSALHQIGQIRNPNPKAILALRQAGPAVPKLSELVLPVQEIGLTQVNSGLENCDFCMLMFTALPGLQ